MPAGAMDAEWRCPKCEGILSMKSFGYEGKGKKSKRVRWVSADRKWTKTKPEKDFELDNWYIVTEGLPLI